MTIIDDKCSLFLIKHQDLIHGKICKIVTGSIYLHTQPIGKSPLLILSLAGSVQPSHQSLLLLELQSIFRP